MSSAGVPIYCSPFAALQINTPADSEKLLLGFRAWNLTTAFKGICGNHLIYFLLQIKLPMHNHMATNPMIAIFC